MTNYEIEINEILKNDPDNNKKMGIWAQIKNTKTGEIINKRIWWKDHNGIFHDDTIDLPISIRDLIDNAWFEYSH